MGCVHVSRPAGHPASARVDSNSTRTESCVAMGPDPEARMQVDALKAADHSGYQQIIRPSRGMQAGLKTLRLVSLQDCQSSAECGPRENPVRFPLSQEMFPPNSHATRSPGPRGDEARQSERHPPRRRGESSSVIAPPQPPKSMREAKCPNHSAHSSS